MKQLFTCALVVVATSCGDDPTDTCLARRDRMIEQSLDKRGLAGPEREAHREALLAAAGKTVMDVCLAGGRR